MLRKLHSLPKLQIFTSHLELGTIRLSRLDTRYLYIRAATLDTRYNGNPDIFSENSGRIGPGSAVARQVFNGKCAGNFPLQLQQQSPDRGVAENYVGISISDP